MADDETKAAPPAEATPATPEKKPRARAKAAPPEAKKAAPAPKADTTAKDGDEKEKDDQPEGPRAPKRAELTDARRTLLRVRSTLDRRRPVFGRQAANRYYRIGRDGAWRRPRGLQSKQRRHYGYRPHVVRIGYRSPASVRGLVPSGFRPVIVRTTADLDAIDARAEAAVIARTIGTRRRLVLEEAARKLGVHILNPIVKSDTES